MNFPKTYMDYTKHLFPTPLSGFLWAIACIFFLVHQIFQKLLHFPISIADNWLDPLLLPIIMLPVFRIERQWLLHKPGYSLSGIEVLAYSLALIFISEGLLPLLSTRFTYDPIDIVAIATGSLIYALWMR